ncbi:hypothetical protein DQ04_09161040 [Trypanosoma grayi]|uniref:hypothetical protein n=1 Tax=Trypanosoma grayi TaxID=71804 RepID=UPI0004F42209|nr:hypothetical protein DQ04_09161040 [Trypanosoma grayi]KEG07661.1 hypothetical protein DQ04_09161040 [Trypanosoma grayi]
MFSTCLWFVFWWSSLVTEIHLPELSRSFGPVNFRNLTCGNVRIGATNATFNSSLWSLETTELSEISCSIDVEMGVFHSQITSLVAVSPSHVSLRKSPDDQCLCAVVSKDHCSLDVKMRDTKLEPPNALLQGVVNLAKDFVERKAEPYVCEVALPRLEEELQKHEVNPPVPVPALKKDSTPLSTSPLFRAAVNIVNNVPEVLGVRLNATVDAETTVRLGMSLPHGLHASLGNTAGPGASPETLLDMLKLILKALDIEGVVPNTTRVFPVIEGGGAEAEVPHPFGVSLDISFDDLQCDEAGYSCTLQCDDGITLHNLRVEKLGEWQRVIVNDMDPIVLPFINRLINSMTAPFCNTTVGRFQLPTRKSPSVLMTPPMALYIPSVLVAVFFVCGVVALSIRRQKGGAPVTLQDGTPVPLRRVVAEDAVLTLLVMVTALGFIWSNSTTGATLVMGDEVGLLSFSLMETTRSLYNAGLRPLAVLVFAFSGVYPYVKLLCILVCTLILEKPDLVILKIVDYFGKFSFLDSYAMVIMASGLQMAGIAEVNILPGFYVFLAATILSIITGNFATTIWRRNTTLRQCEAQTRSEISSEESLSLVPLFVANSEDVTVSRRVFTFDRRCIFLQLLNGTVVTACVLPVWVTPCLRYRVSGVASIIQPDERNMTLYELASVSSMLLVTCIFTIGIAPILYAFMYPRCALLASWGAADALLLACVAGLLQIGQFVEFIIGKNMGAIYSAEAQLLWPLIPLLISAVWQWVLAAEHIFGLTGRIKGRWKARKAEIEF